MGNEKPAKQQNTRAPLEQTRPQTPLGRNARRAACRLAAVGTADTPLCQRAPSSRAPWPSAQWQAVVSPPPVVTHARGTAAKFDYIRARRCSSSSHASQKPNPSVPGWDMPCLRQHPRPHSLASPVMPGLPVAYQFFNVTRTKLAAQCSMLPNPRTRSFKVGTCIHIGFAWPLAETYLPIAQAAARQARIHAFPDGMMQGSAWRAAGRLRRPAPRSVRRNVCAAVRREPCAGMCVRV